MVPNKSFAKLELFTDNNGNICVERSEMDMERLKELFDTYAPDYPNITEFFELLTFVNGYLKDTEKALEKFYV